MYNGKGFVRCYVMSLKQNINGELIGKINLQMEPNGFILWTTLPYMCAQKGIHTHPWNGF